MQRIQEHAFVGAQVADDAPWREKSPCWPIHKVPGYPICIPIGQKKVSVRNPSVGQYGYPGTVPYEGDSHMFCIFCLEIKF